jgi:hypothetical protein
MKRAVIAVPLLVLACVASDSVSPDKQGSSSAVQGLGSTSFALVAGSGCTYDNDTNSYVCTYEFDEVGNGQWDVWLSGVWSLEYQCLHARTGKTIKRYSQLTGDELNALLVKDAVFAVSGTISGTDVLPPPDPCSQNKGPFTQLNLISSAPQSWEIFILPHLSIE